MSSAANADDPRRRLLIRALAAGLFAWPLVNRDAPAQVLGGRPAPLPAGRSIYRIDGEVRVDGAVATVATRVAANSTVETARDGQAIYAVGQSAFIQRGDSRVTLSAREPGSVVVSGVQVLAGKILSVHPAGRGVAMTTKNASIGIRGTGVYVEEDPDQTYFCTCYGVTDVVAVDDPTSRETVISRHHDRPLYILAGQPAGRSIRAAPFINHTDQELALIETLVGRTLPFVFPKSDYRQPRRTY